MQIDEGKLRFEFPGRWETVKYDNVDYYTTHFQSFLGGAKAVDILAMNLDSSTLWLVEVKDYRNHARAKPQELWLEVAEKVRDTFVGLISGRDQTDLQKFQPLPGLQFKVVLHLEQPAGTRLRPQAYDPANLRLKLHQQLKPLVQKADIIVCDKTTLRPRVRWDVSDI